MVPDFASPLPARSSRRGRRGPARAVFPLLLAVLAGVGVSAAAQSAPEDSVFERAGEGTLMERLGTISAGLTTLGRDPAWTGLLYDEERDPDILRPTWYVIRMDSTVWVRTPDGESVVLDPYVATKLGNRVGEETGYGEAQAQGFGWGWYGGRFHLYASRGFEPMVAISLAVVLVALVIAVMAWLVWALRRSRARERALAESRRRLAEARETERLRIAREIHDGPVQDLHALRLHVQAGAEADPIDRDVLAVVDGLRAISENLRPPTLDAMGLDVSVGAFIGRFERTFPDIRTDLVVEGTQPVLNATVALTLFRVVQESMNNAAQHGDPESVTVLLDYGAEAVRVVVEDDGQGFEVPANIGSPQASPEGHYGLIGIAERAESVGGGFRLVARPSGGIRVEFMVPRPLALADPVQTD